MVAMEFSCIQKMNHADEATTALDVTIQAQILDLLKNLAREFRTAFILITHDLGVVAGMTQRIHVMYGGENVGKGHNGGGFSQPQKAHTPGVLPPLPPPPRHPQTKASPPPSPPPPLL